MTTTAWRPEGLLITLKTGAADLGLLFDVNAPYAGCALCGALYQTNQDRQLTQTPRAPLWWLLKEAADSRRLRWRKLHTRRYHTTKEVETFEKWRLETGFAFTPEAANKLAAFGIVSNHVNDDLHRALIESSPLPTEDCLGS